MMLNWQDPRALIKVAKLYYEKEKTQAEIAKVMGVSRPIISKMLQKAKQDGIVEIKIHAPDETLYALEEQLCERFGLEETALVMSTPEESADLVKIRTAKLAASYIIQQLKPGHRISVSWGTTLSQWVQEITPSKLDNIEVIPLVGGIGQSRFELHSNFLAQQLAEKLHAECYQLYAPVIVENADIRQSLLSDNNIADVLRRGAESDLAVVGIGDPFKSTMERAGYLGEGELTELKEVGAVGDCCSQFVDKDGQLCDTPLNQRVMAVPLAELKKGPRVVAICGGLHKLDSLFGVLKGGFIDVLVSDRLTAEQLLQKEEA